MKNAIVSIAALLTLLFSIHTIASAQITATWKGGAPGQENNWDCPKNWSNYRVPDSFTDVVIPDVSTTSQETPVINNGVFEVNSIRLYSNAHLTVEKDAQLLIYDADNCFFNEQLLHIKGALSVFDEYSGKFRQMGDQLYSIRD